MAKKSNKAPAPAPEPVPGKKKGKRGARIETEEEKKARLANRAKVTSTASWTGKLPHTLLHENCQKRKWNKVEYDMRKAGDSGMLATTILSYTDPKTKENLTVKMHDPTYDKKTGKGVLTPQETPMEARHMAATLALYRIASNSNMHMTLPPNHRKIWYELEDFRKSISKSNPDLAQRLFDADPFKTLVADRKLKDIKNKEREAKQQQAEKVQKAPTLITSVSKNDKAAAAPRISKQRNEPRDKRVIRFPQKVWNNASFIDLRESSRTAIERSLKMHIDWESKKTEVENDNSLLKQKLINLGFRTPHIEEALLYKDPLSFLLFNLPEDDLPSFFQKRQEDTRMRVEITSLPLRVQNMISRLMESGASYAEALYALEASDYDENEAAGKLTEKLFTDSVETPSNLGTEESSELWNQELESLQSIYGYEMIEVLNSDKTCYTIKLIEKFNLKLKVYKTKNYPNNLPGLIVSTFDKNYKLPNYIKQVILTRLLKYVSKSSLLGDMLVYHLYEWLQGNLAGIIENPGSLLPEDAKVISTGAANKRNGQNKEKLSKTRGFGLKTISKNEIEALKAEHEARIGSRKYAEMLKQRSQLPAWKVRDHIVDLIKSNDVVLISGETGSGKSTQAVQFVLDHLLSQGDFSHTKIICTQPRRISAIGLAERVSDERCTTCGTEVGYTIRGVNKTKPSTRIRFMTTGVLVRMLQSSRS